MVLALNLLVGFFLIVVAFLLYKTTNSVVLSADSKLKRVVAILVFCLISFWVYQSSHPSYLSKGKVDRVEVPEFEVIEGKIVDITPKPIPGAERDIKRKEAYKEPLPFKEQNKIDNK